MPHHGEGVGVAGVTHYKRILEPIGVNDFGGQNPPAVGRVYLRPYQVEFPMTIDRLALVVRVANGNGILGVYEDNGDTPAGGALVVESAAIAFVFGVQEFPIVPVSLVGQLIWIALEGSDATASWGRTGLTAVAANATLDQYFYDRGAFGALTDPCPAVAVYDGAPPWISYMRVASVP